MTPQKTLHQSAPGEAPLSNLRPHCGPTSQKFAQPILNQPPDLQIEKPAFCLRSTPSWVWHPYLWDRWVTPRELCPRHHSGFHRRADSARQSRPPRQCWTADLWCQPGSWVGRFCGSLCPTHTAAQSPDRLPGSSGAPGCCCNQDMCLG